MLGLDVAIAFQLLGLPMRLPARFQVIVDSPSRAPCACACLAAGHALHIVDFVLVYQVAERVGVLQVVDAPLDCSKLVLRAPLMRNCRLSCASML